MSLKETLDKLTQRGLKITPQRIAVLEAVVHLNNHPTVEQIIEYIRINQPNIAIATVYKVLDALVNNDLLRRVNTDKDVTRYDAVLEPHHHIYYSDSSMIEDYIDNKLSEMLQAYFDKNRIPGFTIEDIRLQIIGKSQKKTG